MQQTNNETEEISIHALRKESDIQHLAEFLGI